MDDMWDTKRNWEMYTTFWWENTKKKIKRPLVRPLCVNWRIILNLITVI
jgi:hypothetical protein